MPAWTFDCVLGPGPGLSLGTTRAQVKIDLDAEHRLPLGPPVLTLKVEGTSMCASVMLSADKLRELAKCLQEAADKYDELDANYDIDRRRSKLRQEADALWAAGDKRGATELHEEAAELGSVKDE